LQLVDADATGNPLVFDTTRRDEVVAIEPIFNRMILFNASKWHKVTPITSGKRYSLAVNANSHKPKVMTKYGATDLN
jgi:Rps23 Pro-64 3,4-dihydroxylase Tpa1-like proline 4-hydroxylase